MKKVIFAIILLAVGLGFVAGYYCYDPIYKWKRERQLRAKFMDKPAPAFETTTMDGLPWSLRDTRGKVVLVDFWATWCSYSIKAIPIMKKLNKKYGSRDDFMLVGISLDCEREKLQKMTAKKGMKWVQLCEEGTKWRNSAVFACEIRSIPSVWILDRQGLVRGMNLHDEEEIIDILEKTLR